MPLLSIIIPVYNEGGNIRHAIELINAKLKHEHEILIIYDFDGDNTLPVIHELNQKNIRLVKNAYGKGALNAIKTGLESGTGKYEIVTMADLSDPPEVMNSMIELAERDNASIVCASRYMKGGSQHTNSLKMFIKGIMSRTAGMSLYYLAGVPTHDATNSFKLYAKSFLERVKIESSGGFELGIELVVKAYSMGLIIREVPTEWHDRTEGKSRFKILKWLPNYLHWYFYAFTHRHKKERH